MSLLVLLSPFHGTLGYDVVRTSPGRERGQDWSWGEGHIYGLRSAFSSRYGLWAHVGLVTLGAQDVRL